MQFETSEGKCVGCWTGLRFLNATPLPVTKKSPFFSSDESEEEEDHRKKFKIKIKPLLADRVVAAPTVDELKASIGNISLSPSPVVSHPDITASFIRHLWLLTATFKSVALFIATFSGFVVGVFFFNAHKCSSMRVLSTGCIEYFVCVLLHMPPQQKAADCCVHHSHTAGFSLDFSNATQVMSLMSSTHSTSTVQE